MQSVTALCLFHSSVYPHTDRKEQTLCPVGYIQGTKVKFSAFLNTCLEQLRLDLAQKLQSKNHFAEKRIVAAAAVAAAAAAAHLRILDKVY